MVCYISKYIYLAVSTERIIKVKNYIYIILASIVLYFRYTSEINELFGFLIKQDSLTAAAAYNVMICGLTKHLRVYQF